MQRRHRHALRSAVLAAAATAAWWRITGPQASAEGLARDDWASLGWAILAAEAGAWSAARLVVFFAGPAWWVALTTSRARASWRHVHDVRPHIPDRLRRWVYAADGYACVACGQVRGQPCEWCDGLVVLQLEHVKAWSWGGLTSLWNLITLCEHCNRVKSNYWIMNGRAYYRGWEDADDIEAAHAILMAGLAAQRSPARLARLAWAHWLG